eukprot:760765-Hanusia_phi.AAC.7
MFMLLIAWVCLQFKSSRSLQWQQVDEESCRGGFAHRNCPDVQRFYHVGPDLADSLTSCNMMVYVVFVFPAAFFLERFGLSVGVITATTLTCLGSWIRIFGGTSDGFHALLVGQIVESIANVVFMNAPAALSAATSIAAMSNAVGSGDRLVPATRGRRIRAIQGSGSASRPCSYHRMPPPPPLLLRSRTFSVFGVEGSPKEMDGITMNRRGDMVTEMKACIRSPSFLTLFTAFSLGTFILVGGVCGSAVIGSYLDRSKRLKETMQRISSCSVTSSCRLRIVTSSCPALVSWQIGLELGAESSYPTSEALSSSLLVLGGQEPISHRPPLLISVQVCGVLLIAGMELLAGSYACKERYSLSPDPAVPCRFPCCLLCLNSTSNDATVLEPARDATSSLALMVRDEMEGRRRKGTVPGRRRWAAGGSDRPAQVGVLVISCCVSWSFRGEYLRMQVVWRREGGMRVELLAGGRSARR